MAELVILEPAQRELEEIAQLHLNLVGPNSARKITDLMLDTLSRLEMFPLSGHIPQDKELRNGGYRLVIAGEVYLCLPADCGYGVRLPHRARRQQLPNNFQTAAERRKSITHFFRERLFLTERRQTVKKPR